jgi:hypothetical protein
MVCLDPAAVADAWAGRVADHWAGHCRGLCQEPGHGSRPWALAAAQALEAVRQELLSQPRAEPWQLERKTAAGEPEREPPAAQDARQSAVPV